MDMEDLSSEVSDVFRSEAVTHSNSDAVDLEEPIESLRPLSKASRRLEEENAQKRVFRKKCEFNYKPGLLFGKRIKSVL